MKKKEKIRIFSNDYDRVFELFTLYRKSKCRVQTNRRRRQNVKHTTLKYENK